MTLVEVIVAMSIAAFIIASAMGTIMYFYRMSVISAYESGAMRVLQTHAERINNLQLSQVTNTHVVNFNYSGLRLTTAASLDGQDDLTNVMHKTYIFSTLPTNQVMTLNQTNVTEDAVVAYLTTITVSDLNTTNTVLGSSTPFKFKKVDINTFWHALGYNKTNSATIIRYY